MHSELEAIHERNPRDRFSFLAIQGEVGQAANYQRPTEQGQIFSPANEIAELQSELHRRGRVCAKHSRGRAHRARNHWSFLVWPRPKPYRFAANSIFAFTDRPTQRQNCITGRRAASYHFLDGKVWLFGEHQVQLLYSHVDLLRHIRQSNLEEEYARL